jgi:shikimate kinase
MNIFLIGYRCTGKTSVGKLLAEKLGWDFADSDAEIVKTQGMSISEMVAKHGWDFFREKEREVIAQLSQADRHVVATGGGVVLNPENVRDMKANGLILWLKAMPEAIRKRIVSDEHTEALRPALTSKGFLGEIEDTLAARMPLYESAMDFFVDTDALSAEQIAESIVTKLSAIDAW